MGANEIANRLLAMCVVQVRSSTDFRFVESMGFSEIIRKGVGQYQLTLVQPLAFSVPPATSPFIARCSTVPESYNVGGTGTVRVGGIPIDSISSYTPGSINLQLFSDDPPTTAADEGIALVKVWQFPSIG